MYYMMHDAARQSREAVLAADSACLVKRVVRVCCVPLVLCAVGVAAACAGAWPAAVCSGCCFTTTQVLLTFAHVHCARINKTAWVLCIQVARLLHALDRLASRKMFRLSKFA
jgi:hypothetical protein